MSKVQPTLAAFLKRSTNAAISSTPTSTSATISTTASAAVVQSKADKSDSETSTDKSIKKIRLEASAVESSSSSTTVLETNATESKDVAVSAKGSQQETTVLSSSVKSSVTTSSMVTWVDAEIERLEDEKWKALLKKEAAKSRSLFSFLHGLPESRILPPKPKVFEAFRLCPFDQVKVVILGQDPYHGKGQAHGLSFSVMDGVQVPPSLRNIYKEATNDIKAKNGISGNLECWAKQGVLLLNALLTVEAGTPMAHKGKGWERFTDSCIAALSKERKNLVFMLWGKPAQEKGKIVDRSKHLVITSSHPSPLGASQTAEPFLGSKCFSRCNAYLKDHGMDEIDWNVH